MPKKKNDEKIDLVRKILDNPNELSSSKPDKYTDALRHRLRQQKTHSTPFRVHTDTRDNGLKPSVFIHHEEKKEEPIQTKEEPIPFFGPSSQGHHETTNGLYNNHEDIFEIEHVSDQDIPDFIEVKPKEKKPEIKQEKQSLPQFESVEETTTLPKWELVEEKKRSEPIEPVSEQKEEIIDESPKEDISKKEENIPKPVEQQKTAIWESVSVKKEKQKKTPRKQLFKRNLKEKKTEEDSKDPSSFHVAELKKSIQKIGEHKDHAPYSFKGYRLYQKEIDLGNNKKRVIHFFSKDEPEESIPSALPSNYEVKINKKTGVPYIRKKST